jgi:DNA-binding MarR family transcriptional regulator
MKQSFVHAQGNGAEMGRVAKPVARGDGDESIEVPRAELLRLSFLLAEMAEPDEPNASTRRHIRRTDLIAYARSLIRRRRARTRYFANAMLGEPAWDLLLVLYVAEGTAECVSVNAAAELAGLAATSAKRWIEYLEKEHLVLRRPHERDSRRIVLTLSAKGQASLDSYFSGIVGNTEDS